MKHIFFILLISAFMSDNVNAQNQGPKPGTAPECSQFDFWVGEWDLTYNDTVHAENHITKEMSGCLIHEHFHDPTHAYTGESWSMYNVKTKKWQQTWVDNMAEYITLNGEFKDGKMILLTDILLQPDGTKKQNRMVYYNITATTFDWDWEETRDDGKTWVNKWRIHYKRKH